MSYITKTVSALLSLVMLSSVSLAEDNIWISIGQDGLSTLQKKSLISISASQSESTLNALNSNDVALINVNLNDLSHISELMHIHHNRCGGFVAHESEAEGLAYLQDIQSVSSLASLVSYDLTNAQVVSSLQAEMSESDIRQTIIDLASFTNRYYTTQTGLEGAQWIHDKWTVLAEGRSDISVEYVNHSWKQPSVMLTIMGRSLPDEIVVLGAHLDSIVSGTMGENTRAPGADDDASGIATLTELIDTVVNTGFKPNRTIVMFGYAAEEVGLRGSKAIAEDFKTAGKNVVGVLQLDMTNYQGSTKDIYLMTDYTNAAQNDFLMSLGAAYLPGVTMGTSTCGYGCSDHASWHQEGFPASFPFEATFSGANPHIHTAQDTLAQSANNAFHALKFGKLAAAYIAELAKGNMTDTPDPDPEPGSEITETVLMSLAKDQQGTAGPYMAKTGTVVSVEMTGTNDADLYVKVGSAPTTSSYDCRPYKNGSAELCSVSVGDVDAGVYVMVRGYSSATSDVTVKTTFEPSGDNTTPTDEVTDVFSNTVARNTNQYYGPFSVNPGSDFNATMTGTNDADLYVQFSTQPSTSSYACRPYQSGSSEQCDVVVPSSVNEVYVMVRGYSSQESSYDLSVIYQPE
jgi:leucyl aminopeptidase